MTIQAASDPTWEERSSEPEQCKWAEPLPDLQPDIPELPPDKRPGSEGPRLELDVERDPRYRR